MTPQASLGVFGGKSHGHPAFWGENTATIQSFSTLFLMSTPTWITEKEPERVMKNKGDEFGWKKKHENFIAAVRI